MTDADRLVAAEAARDALPHDGRIEWLEGELLKFRLAFKELDLVRQEAEQEVARLRAACQQLTKYYANKQGEMIQMSTGGIGDHLYVKASALAAVLAGQETP